MIRAARHKARVLLDTYILRNPWASDKKLPQVHRKKVGFKRLRISRRPNRKYEKASPNFSEVGANRRVANTKSRAKRVSAALLNGLLFNWRQLTLMLEYMEKPRHYLSSVESEEMSRVRCQFDVHRSRTPCSFTAVQINSDLEDLGYPSALPHDVNTETLTQSPS